MSLEDPLELMAEDETFDVMLTPSFKEQQIEFFYSVGMACPIADCNVGGKFQNKTRYQRHWEERHVQQAEKWECAYANCGALVRRKSDMKSHIRYVHFEKDNQRVEEILLKCTRKTVRSKGFIDPGFFTYKGRSEKGPVPSPAVVSSKTTSSSTTSSTVALTRSKPSDITPSVSLVTSVLSTTENQDEEMEDVEFTVRIPAKNPSKTSVTPAAETTEPSSHPSEPTSVASSSESVPSIERSSVGVKKTLSLLNYKNTRSVDTTRPSRPELPVLPLFANSAVSSTQTSAMDVKEVYLPPIPESLPELEDHLRFLCNCMDQVGRQREAAKIRLEQLRRNAKEDNTLAREREQRRKLESENRELRRQIAEMKWREQLFPGIEEE